MPVWATELLAALQGVWVQIPAPIREALMTLLKPVLTPLAWATAGAVAFMMAAAVLGGRGSRHNRLGTDSVEKPDQRFGTFDPAAGISKPRNSHLPWYMRVFYTFTGSDPIIMAEMPYHMIRNRIVLGIFLMMASCWALFGAYYFLTHIYPSIETWQLGIAVSLYAVTIYLIDLTILGQTGSPPVKVVILRILVSVLISLLVSSPISVGFFKSKLDERVEGRINIEALRTGETNARIDEEKAELKRLKARQEALIKQRDVARATAVEAEALASEAQTLATEEERGTVVKGNRLKGATSGVPSCGPRCAALKAQADLASIRQKSATQTAAGLSQQIHATELEILRIEERVASTIQAKTSAAKLDFLAAESELRKMMVNDPSGDGFMAIVISLAIMALDLLVLLGKSMISSRPYEEREKLLEEVTRDNNHDFRVRSSPQPMPPHPANDEEEEEHKPRRNSKKAREQDEDDEDGDAMQGNRRAAE